MKRLIFAGLVALASFGAVQLTLPEAKASSDLECKACPDGCELRPYCQCYCPIDWW